MDGGNQTEGTGTDFQFQDYPPFQGDKYRKACLLFDMPSFVRLMLSFTGFMCFVKATTLQVLFLLSSTSDLKLLSCILIKY